MADKYVVVFDTNVFLQALANTRGAAVRCLEYFEQGKIILAISRDTFNEITEVLSRSHLRQKYPLLTDERIALLFEQLLYHGIYLRQVKQHFSYPRDPKDEPYLNLAIEADADYLISRDRDLLDLMNWNREEGREFQQRFRTLQVLTPEEFLSVMEQSMA